MYICETVALFTHGITMHLGWSDKVLWADSNAATNWHNVFFSGEATQCMRAVVAEAVEWLIPLIGGLILNPCQSVPGQDTEPQFGPEGIARVNGKSNYIMLIYKKEQMIRNLL